MLNKPTDRERFDASYNKGGPGECWPWTGKTNGKHGQFLFNGRSRSAHRLAHELSSGEPVPASSNVIHTCSSRLCVNPAHLAVVTRAESGRIAGTLGGRLSPKDQIGWIADDPNEPGTRRYFPEYPPTGWQNARRVYIDRTETPATL